MIHSKIVQNPLASYRLVDCFAFVKSKTRYLQCRLSRKTHGDTSLQMQAEDYSCQVFCPMGTRTPIATPYYPFRQTRMILARCQSHVKNQGLHRIWHEENS